jgi:hypothetical protein
LPDLIIGGTQHKAATSFKAANMAAYEKMKLYREQGVVWVAPTRGTVHTSVVVSWLSLQWPMNHPHTSIIVAEGVEVAAAYEMLFKWSMNRSWLRKSFEREYADAVASAPFVLTTEEDNVIPGDAVPKLMEAIYTCPDCGGEVGGREWKCEAGHRGFDAISGLYWLKSDPPVPMAFGSPTRSRTKFDFRPVSVTAAVKKGSVVEVNGIAMGCALWRKDLFRKVSSTQKEPWFKTTPNFTQDLYFCRRAKREVGARFGVHAGVRVAHYNPNTKQFF